MTTPDAAARARERLGPVGVRLDDLRLVGVSTGCYVAWRTERLRYGSRWTGDGIGGNEDFTLLAALLADASTMVTGIAIANVWVCHPAMVWSAAAPSAKHARVDPSSGWASARHRV